MELGAFKDYEAEFLQRSGPLTTQVNSLLSQVDVTPSSASLLKTTEQELNAASKVLRSMDLEAKGLSDPARTQLVAKVKTYQESLARVSADFKRAQDKIQRGLLIGSGRADSSGRPLEFGKSADARQRMEESTNKLQSGTGILEGAHSRLEETIGVGEFLLHTCS